LLDEHIGHVAARIRELRSLERQLKGLRDLCQEARDAAHCGILNELARQGSEGGSSAAGHVHGAHGRSVERKSINDKRNEIERLRHPRRAGRCRTFRRRHAAGETAA